VIVVQNDSSNLFDLQQYPMAMKSSLNDIVRCWGILDLCCFVWYIGWRSFHGDVPFIHDIVRSIETARSFEHSSPIYLTLMSVLLYLSLAASGLLLFRRKISGVIIVYLQTPFRFVLIMPSLFFILWPLHYLHERPSMMLGIALILASEVLKVSTIIRWHMVLKKSYSQSIHSVA
jgi:hypothetical protein